MSIVDRRRIHYENSVEDSGGPVIYWMNREHRVHDNWGLLHARELAAENRPLAVVYCLPASYLGATLRQYEFMLRGLEEVESNLAELGIPFIFKTGFPGIELPELVRELSSGVVVTDFDPLRIKQEWLETFCCNIDIRLLVVDGHNIVPARFVSEKREYAARTIRPKIHKLLPEFLTEYPSLRPIKGLFDKSTPTDWKKVLDFIEVDSGVPVVDLPAGEKAAKAALDDFLRGRMNRYADQRNDPNAGATSGLSPYYHFGHLAPQRAALEIYAAGAGVNQDAYLEELIVRRELSDNFVFHTPHYDSLEGAPQWARNNLADFAGDPREYLYTYDEFESGQTHSGLWNAAQCQLRRTGHMHGYMRMFWAKKVLEWSDSPHEALNIVNSLNDRYSLDGCDPNGYTGALWSVAGLHDRPWKKRPVFGSIRYMNEKGCRRKFDVDLYVEKWSC